MRIKRFLAASLHDAKEQIVNELGMDAVVLSSRQVRRQGILGWLGFSQVEVTAAIDTPVPNTPAAFTPTPPLAVVPETTEAPWQSLQQDLMETKRIVAIMSKNLQTAQGQPMYPEAVAAYYSRLQTIGLTNELAAAICEEITAQLTAEEVVRQQAVEQLGNSLLSSRLAPYSEKPTAQPKIICLIGPTGVGKTTTIAKLAANAALNQKQRVALVTFDTYRIAAVDQLRTYGDILGAPVEVALTPGEMRQAIEKLQGYDVIFVDSVGRSQQNRMQLSELKAFLEAVRADEVLLTLSATTQYEIMQEIVENYQPAKPTALVFTKLDETRHLGTVVNLLLATGLPVAFLTNGQDVPDDLLQPDPEDLVQLLFGVHQA